MESINENTSMNIAKTSHYKMIALVVGLLYLAGFVVGIGGNVLVLSAVGAPDYLAKISAKSIPVAIGAVLWLLAVAGDAAHGVVMFPILKRTSERLALGYLAARILDAIFIAIMVIFILLQVPLGGAFLKADAQSVQSLQMLGSLLSAAQHVAYVIGMCALGVSGLLLCAVLLRARLVPSWLAVWGLFGYAIILLGMLSEIFGSGLGDVSSIPGGLWEVFMGVWLIVKGFSSAAVTPSTAGPGVLAASAAA